MYVKSANILQEKSLGEQRTRTLRLSYSLSTNRILNTMSH